MAQKSILITGSSSGIGYDAAKTLHARGWQVFASCRKTEDCARLKEEGLLSPQLDVADPASVREALAEVLETTGGTLGALFNNAGFAIPGAVEDMPRGALESNFATNVFGLHDLTCQVIPVMRAQGYGRIVNNSSVLGYVTLRWRGSYNATKHALEGLTDTLRVEMRDTPIHVITIQPGPVTAKIRENSIPHFEKWVDWKASPRRAQYETSLMKRLYESSGPDAFELPAAAVSKKLIHALESPRPRAQYKVTVPAQMMSTMRRVLPRRALDWLLSKA